MDMLLISDRQDLDFAQACSEYREITVFLKRNRPEFGWLSCVLAGYDERLDYLRQVIVDFVIKVIFEKKVIKGDFQCLKKV